jgi:hypothetical protein
LRGFAFGRTSKFAASLLDALNGEKAFAADLKSEDEPN